MENKLETKRKSRSMETKLETKRRSIMNTTWGRLIRKLPFPLPPHILQVIFSKLSVSNLPACRLVCKTWNHVVLDYANPSSKLPIPNTFFLISSDLNPNYVRYQSCATCNPKMHCIDIDTLSSVASFGFDGDWADWADIVIINSCNGLLFINKSTFHTWCNGILNPMTNEFFKLPGSELVEDIYTYGFGFSPKTKQYKLFRVLTKLSTYIMEIFTFDRSGTNHNQWKHVSLSLPISLHDHGAYLNGVIYWVGREKGNEFVIYALDVETENIKLSAVLEVGTYAKEAHIQPLNGTIYAIIFIDDAPYNKIQLWRMLEKNSWIRDFVICDMPVFGVFYLIEAFEDGEILFLHRGEFFCLDKTGRKIKIKTFHSNPNAGDVTWACHIESLKFDSFSNMLTGYN